MGTEIGQSLIIQLFKQFKKKKINEIHTAARWDAVDILFFTKSIGLTGAILLVRGKIGADFTRRVKAFLR